MTTPALEIGDEAFRYLTNQRGALWDIQADRRAWERAYAEELAQTYGLIDDFLRAPPASASSRSSTGIGMGGIDLMLWGRYRPGRTITSLTNSR